MSAPIVRQRKFPHPYRAMLAICSDIDRTSLARFRSIHRFLNTRTQTPIGQGVGLDVADSMWVFKQNRSELALRLGLSDGGEESTEADELAHYVAAGWIDSLHSYGNFTARDTSQFERRHAEIAIAELEHRGLRLHTWVNHGGRSNTQNFGSRPFTLGDVPGTTEFHTDLLLHYGVRYAWDQCRGLAFGVDQPLAPTRLRDGRRLWGFSRHTSVAGPVAQEIANRHGVKLDTTEHGDPRCAVWWPHLLGYQLSEENLDCLVQRGQYCIVAQHLGDLRKDEHFRPEAITAFRRLRALQDAGRLLVARTSRLLEYYRVAAHLEYEVRSSGRLDIDITAVRDPVIGTFVPSLDQIRGVTFYVAEPDAAYVFLNGRPVPKSNLVRSGSGPDGPTIGVRWFAEDATDHAAVFAEAHGPQPVKPLV